MESINHNDLIREYTNHRDFLTFLAFQRYHLDNATPLDYTVYKIRNGRRERSRTCKGAWRPVWKGEASAHVVPVVRSLMEFTGRQCYDNEAIPIDPLLLRFDVITPDRITPGQRFIIVYQDSGQYTVDIVQDGEMIRTRTGSGTFEPETEGETDGTLMIFYPFER